LERSIEDGRNSRASDHAAIRREGV
jgi:hypothetical protein